MMPREAFVDTNKSLMSNYCLVGTATWLPDFGIYELIMSECLLSAFVIYKPDANHYFKELLKCAECAAMWWKQ